MLNFFLWNQHYAYANYDYATSPIQHVKLSLPAPPPTRNRSIGTDDGN